MEDVDEAKAPGAAIEGDGGRGGEERIWVSACQTRDGEAVWRRPWRFPEFPARQFRSPPGYSSLSTKMHLVQQYRPRLHVGEPRTKIVKSKPWQSVIISLWCWLKVSQFARDAP